MLAILTSSVYRFIMSLLSTSPQVRTHSDHSINEVLAYSRIHVQQASVVQDNSLRTCNTHARRRQLIAT